MAGGSGASSARGGRRPRAVMAPSAAGAAPRVRSPSLRSLPPPPSHTATPLCVHTPRSTAAALLPTPPRTTTVTVPTLSSTVFRPSRSVFKARSTRCCTLANPRQKSHPTVFTSATEAGWRGLDGLCTNSARQRGCVPFGDGGSAGGHTPGECGEAHRRPTNRITKSSARRSQGHASAEPHPAPVAHANAAAHPAAHLAAFRHAMGAAARRARRQPRRSGRCALSSASVFGSPVTLLTTTWRRFGALVGPYGGLYVQRASCGYPRLPVV